MSKSPDEGKLLHKETSPTAQTVGTERLFGPSGVQTYRAVMQTAMGGVVHVDVDAATGDEAAESALKEVPGGKVMNITPSPNQKPRD